MRNDKRGDVIGLSFSMIFSIILIVIFIVIAFIGINAFLKTKDCAKIGIFIDDLRGRVDNAWNSQQDDSEFKGSIPSNLEYVCLFDLEKNPVGINRKIGNELNVYEGTGSNLFLYPPEKACSTPRHSISHLDIEKITKSQNPYCIKIERGSIKFRIKKDFNDKLVSISE